MKMFQLTRVCRVLFSATAVLVLSSSAMAAETNGQSISIVVHPFSASLGSNATDIESALAEKAAAVCGSLENVARLDEVTLNMRTTTAHKINPQGKAGAPNSAAMLMFYEPRVTGTAVVICKQ